MLPDLDSPFLPDSSQQADVLRVLVADDGKNAADIMGLFLKMEGYDVRVVYDGEEAVKETADYQPHVIFMDIAMPGTDGIEASRRIRESRADRIPVIIALSGYDQPETKRQCEEVGIHRHVAKPVSPADLRVLLKEIAAEISGGADGSGI